MRPVNLKYANMTGYETGLYESERVTVPPQKLRPGGPKQGFWRRILFIPVVFAFPCGGPAQESHAHDKALDLKD